MRAGAELDGAQRCGDGPAGRAARGQRRPGAAEVLFESLQSVRKHCVGLVHFDRMARHCAATCAHRPSPGVRWTYAELRPTVDLATIDTEGYCNLVRRIKNIAIRGGEAIYPREIEDLLYPHPTSSTFRSSGCRTRTRANNCHGVLRGKHRAYRGPPLYPLRRRVPDAVTGKVRKFIMKRRMIEEPGLINEKAAQRRRSRSSTKGEAPTWHQVRTLHRA